MPPARLRFTIKRMMIAIFVLGLVMAVTIEWFRYRRVKVLVVNQEITLAVAEVNVLNAALAYDNAVSAVTRHEKELYSNPAPSEASYRMRDGLRGLVERWRIRRQDLKEIWKHERRLLKKLSNDLRHTGFFWPIWNASEPGVSDVGELSQQEAAEIDLKLKKMGHSPIF